MQPIALLVGTSPELIPYHILIDDVKRCHARAPTSEFNLIKGSYHYIARRCSSKIVPGSSTWYLHIKPTIKNVKKKTRPSMPEQRQTRHKASHEGKELKGYGILSWTSKTRISRTMGDPWALLAMRSKALKREESNRCGVGNQCDGGPRKRPIGV